MAPDSVRVTTRHTLHCANEATMSTLESPFCLGPMDYIVPSTLPIEVVFIYKKPRSLPADRFFVVDRLKQAISHLLDYYPHLTGRLQLHPKTHAPQIGHLGAGVDFWEASCSTALRNIAASSLSGRIITPKLPGYGDALLPIFHATVGSISHNAILAVQHTRFACGGVSLGIRIHHQVCDTQGFFQVVRDLAEIYRQLRDSAPPTLIYPPEIRSHFRSSSELSPRKEGKRHMLNASNFYLERENDTKVKKETQKQRTAPVSARVLRFDGQDLAALKQAATNPDPRSDTWVSTFEALSAFLFQRVYKAKVELRETLGHSPEDVPCQSLRQFSTAMDMRDPDRLNLPPRYLANAVHCLSTSASHGNLMKGCLWYIARTIHYAIRSVDKTSVKEDFQWIAAQPDQRRVKSTETFPEGSIAVVQWTRENTYVGTDFEVRRNGKPVSPSLVSPPLSGAYLMDGLAMVIPTEEKVSAGRVNTNSPAESDIPYAVDVNLALNDQIWPYLERDINFLKYIC
ncbi:unnamed protein product [Penicillium salamii]|nr:unnamed protein product [Penicillium salamii]